MEKDLFDRLSKLGTIFMPHADGARRSLMANGGQLAYYTTADTAVKLITNNEFWLRDSRVMNDYTEVRRGIGIVTQHFADDVQRAEFLAVVDATHPGVALEALKHFMNLRGHAADGTYLMSLSRHHADKSKGEDEDEYGRLSMWRAYGKGTGVALVFHLPDKTQPNPSMAFLSPVAYLEDIKGEVAKLIANIKANRDFIAAQDRNQVYYSVLAMLIMASVCLKHPGFREEDEWRILHMAKIYPAPGDLLKFPIKTIDGMPQNVCVMNLADIAKAGMTGLDLNTLIKRVIIGPTAYPDTIADALVAAMTTAGFTDPAKRIHRSYIPLRV